MSVQGKGSSVSGSRVTGRIRKYMKKGEAGKLWDADSPDTPEGRLQRYNPEDWHVPARDEQGHSNSITVEFHPAVLDELAAHVTSDRFPLRRSTQQAIRVAVFELLFILRKLDPLPNSNMALIEGVNYINARADGIIGLEEVFTIGKQKVHKLYAQGAVNEARKTAFDLIRIAKRIESKELRAKYQSAVEREFKGLLKSSKTGVKTNVGKNRAKKNQPEDWEVL